MLYYEPLLNNNFVQKGKYFEATGICEITPNKEVHDKRVKLSSSTMFVSSIHVHCYFIMTCNETIKIVI